MVRNKLCVQQSAQPLVTDMNDPSPFQSDCTGNALCKQPLGRHAGARLLHGAEPGPEGAGPGPEAAQPREALAAGGKVTGAGEQ